MGLLCHSLIASKGSFERLPIHHAIVQRRLSFVTFRTLVCVTQNEEEGLIRGENSQRCILKVYFLSPSLSYRLACGYTYMQYLMQNPLLSGFQSIICDLSAITTGLGKVSPHSLSLSSSLVNLCRHFGIQSVGDITDRLDLPAQVRCWSTKSMTSWWCCWMDNCGKQVLRWSWSCFLCITNIKPKNSPTD